MKSAAPAPLGWEKERERERAIVGEQKKEKDCKVCEIKKAERAGKRLSKNSHVHIVIKYLLPMLGEV